MKTTLRFGLAAILALSPLAFGSVIPVAQSILLAACFLLGSVWVLWRTARGDTALPWRDPVLAAGIGICLFGLFQLLPLPASLMEGISPRTAEMRVRYDPTVEAGEPAGDAMHAATAMRPLSLDSYRTRRSILKTAAYLLVVLVAVDLGADPAIRGFLLRILVFSGLFQALYGIVETFSGRNRIFGYVKHYSVEAISGTFINKNHFAGYLVMALPVAIGLAGGAFAGLLRSDRRRWVSRLKGRESRDIFRANLYLLVSLTLLVALVYSRSRMGIASWILAMGTVAVLAGLRRRHPGFAAITLAVVGAAMLFVGQIGSESGMIDRFRLAPDDFGSELGRRAIWTQTASLAADFPVWGVGLGAYGMAFPPYRTSGAGYAVSHAHNDYLEWFAEAGIAGTVLLIAGGILVWRSRPAGWRDRDRRSLIEPAVWAAILGMSLDSLADFNLSIPSNAVTFCMLLGIWIAWGRRVPSGPRSAPLPRPRSWWPGSIAAAVLVAGGILAAVPVLGAADRETGAAGPGPPPEPGAERPGPESDRMIDVLDGGNPERYFQRAARYGRPSMRDLETLLQIRMDGGAVSTTATRYLQGRFDAAIRWQQEGLRRSPLSAGAHLTLGHLRFSRCIAAGLFDSGAGCGDLVLPQVHLALELNPMSARTHLAAAHLLMSIWPLLEPEDRRRWNPVIERAVRWNPEEGDLAGQWRRLQARSTAGLP